VGEAKGAGDDRAGAASAGFAGVKAPEARNCSYVMTFFPSAKLRLEPRDDADDGTNDELDSRHFSPPSCMATTRSRSHRRSYVYECNRTKLISIYMYLVQAQHVFDWSIGRIVVSCIWPLRSDDERIE
jgi:hypothetical protein